jgi:hypothetical protein
MLKMNKVGELLDRYRNLDKKRQKLVAGALLAVLILLVASVFVLITGRSASEQAAVEDAANAANGFDKTSEHYSFAQFAKAVQYAGEKKCSEARAIYDEAAKHPNGLARTEIDAYKKRIEDLCSGKTNPPPSKNPF